MWTKLREPIPRPRKGSDFTQTIPSFFLRDDMTVNMSGASLDNSRWSGKYLITDKGGSQTLWMDQMRAWKNIPDVAMPEFRGK